MYVITRRTVLVNNTIGNEDGKRALDDNKLQNRAGKNLPRGMALCRFLFLRTTPYYVEVFHSFLTEHGEILEQKACIGQYTT